MASDQRVVPGALDTTGAFSTIGEESLESLVHSPIERQRGNDGQACAVHVRESFLKPDAKAIEDDFFNSLVSPIKTRKKEPRIFVPTYQTKKERDTIDTDFPHVRKRDYMDMLKRAKSLINEWQVDHAPSEEEAADEEVKSRMRDDGFLEIETFIPVEMLRTVWPAAASAVLDPDKAYREIELPNWDATKVTLTLTLTLTRTLTLTLNQKVSTDKRFPKYLGKQIRGH